MLGFGTISQLAISAIPDAAAAPDAEGTARVAWLRA